jgi:Asparagine synthase
LIIKQNIIPVKPIFYNILTNKIVENSEIHNEELDYESICEFVACGFFLEDATYYKNIKVLKPATEYTIQDGEIISEKVFFKWNYNPIERPLSKVVEEFAELFESILDEQTGSKNVILPLSGGLDSRTQAVGLNFLKKQTKSYSYSFKGGLDEARYGKRIAQKCGFDFNTFIIPKGYLWEEIERLANLNNCYSDFTSPRQMAVIDAVSHYGEVFSLGHWGDVLFDDMGVPDDISLEEQVDVVFKKIIKNSGIELAQTLWKEWNLEGDLCEKIKIKIKKNLSDLNIHNSANASIRAYKSMNWAPRWTSTNLSVFESAHSIKLPYFDNRMCQFICSIPEKYLSGRQIQIEYIKYRNPNVAKIEWQDNRPFNLYNYHLNRFPFNFSYRVFSKLSRVFSSVKYVQRNWELQFLGYDNKKQLEHQLFENLTFNELIPQEIVKEFYDKFQSKEQVYYSYPITILLTLSMFAKNRSKSNTTAI